jgi:hypothetical protein
MFLNDDTDCIGPALQQLGHASFEPLLGRYGRVYGTDTGSMRDSRMEELDGVRGIERYVGGFLGAFEDGEAWRFETALTKRGEHIVL